MAVRGKVAKQLRYEQEMAQRWKVRCPNKLRRFRTLRVPIMAEVERRVREGFLS